MSSALLIFQLSTDLGKIAIGLHGGTTMLEKKKCKIKYNFHLYTREKKVLIKQGFELILDFKLQSNKSAYS